MMKRKPKTTAIHIHGRRWFQRPYGNTYHTVAVYVNGEHVFTAERQYGYGDHYRQTAEDWLEANGYLLGREKYSFGGGETLFRYCDRMGIKYVDEVDDVACKGSLHCSKGGAA